MTETLTAAKDWLRDRLDDGAPCPLCTQHAKVYRRKLTAPVGRVLIEMWRHSRDEWVNLPAIGLSRGDEAKARYWELLEAPANAVREDGSSRVGWWRLTPGGVEFVHKRLTVPKYARIYNGRLLGFDCSESVSITDVLGTKFNYQELMQGI